MSKRKGRILSNRCCIFLSFILLATALCAEELWQYEDVESKKSQLMQLRVGADFTKSFEHNLELALSEEVRMDMLPFHTNTVFDRSFTTLSLSYEPIKYLKLDVGYMLKIIGCQDTTQSRWNSHWADVNEYIRHRAFVSVVAQYKYLQWKFAFRERLLCDMRTDSVNPIETNNYDLILRHRLFIDYTVRHKPVKIYTWLELSHTLNAPFLSRKHQNDVLYRMDDSGQWHKNIGYQFIDQIRFCVGTKYRLNKRNTLNFFYRMDWGYSRKAKVQGDYTTLKELEKNHNSTNAEVTLKETTTIQHAIGIAYQFGW